MVGADLDYCDREWFALDMKRDHSAVFEIAPKYCISDSCVDYEGYSISSKGFLPTVLDIREKERYTYLNAEFQRIARRDKKAFLSDQCKETEENNRMGKTSDLFKKTRAIKGTFHAKMGTIKERNGMALTEAEDTKKRWQEYTEELYKKSSRPR